jgi:hypothetical protein
MRFALNDAETIMPLLVLDQEHQEFRRRVALDGLRNEQ